jgi:hypothetical protein
MAMLGVVSMALTSTLGQGVVGSLPMAAGGASR